MNSEIKAHRLNPCPDCQHLCSVDAPFCPNCGKPFPEAAKRNRILDEKIFDKILSQSSTKIGMCLTLLGLIKVLEGVKNVTRFSDELLAINAFGFLLATIFSYLAMKEEDAERKQKKGRVGDIIFSLSLGLLALVCAIMVFELS